MNTVYASLKHAAATLTALIVILGAFQSVIAIFGGHVPPWESPAETQAKIDKTLDAFIRIYYADKCADFNARLMRAAIAFRQNRNDQAASIQYTDFNNEIDAIPNCKKVALP